MGTNLKHTSSRLNSRKVLFVLFAGIFVVAFDIAITGPALPGIQEEFSITKRLISWVIGVYVFFNLAGTPVITKLSDIYGKKTLFLISLLIFLSGSLVVSFSNSFNMLLFGRAVQGLGGGCILPIASAMIGDYFPFNKRGKILGLSGGIFGLAFICGPLFSGIVLSRFNWNYLYMITILPGIFIFILGVVALPSAVRRKKSRIDWTGLYLLCISLGLFAYGINKLDFYQITLSLKQGALFYILVSIFLFAGFILYQTRTRIPLVRIGLFKSRQVILACIIAFGTGVFQASFLFIPDMIVDEFLVDPSKASFMILPFMIAYVIGSPLSGRLVDKSGTRIIVIISLIIVAGGSILFAISNHSLISLIIAEILFGFGLSALVSSSLRYIILKESASSERTITQGMLNVCMNFGQLSGASMIGAIIASAETSTAGYHISYHIITIFAVVMMVHGFFLKSKLKEMS